MFRTVGESIVPEGLLKELRFLIRERADLIETGAMYVNRMQRSLELMNIKLHGVISQIQGKSGLSVIRAILAGERDPEVLLSLCHSTIRDKKAEALIKSPEGNYNESYLFMLKQNLQLWETHQNSVRETEQKIEELPKHPE
jgi:hypothetical protein